MELDDLIVFYELANPLNTDYKRQVLIVLKPAKNIIPRDENEENTQKGRNDSGNKKDSLIIKSFFPIIKYVDYTARVIDFKRSLYEVDFKYILG